MNDRLSPKRINETVITLIPKIKDHVRVSDYRPISLCNTVCKLVSKALVNHLKPILDAIISPNQSAFIPKQCVVDNAILGYESLHTIKNKRQGKTSWAVLKLDMSKVYDRVEWLFLERIILKLGFAKEWVDKIMMCVTTVSYSFNINGDRVGRVIPDRGLRQGDSLSPYLFLFCAEGLSHLIQRAEHSKQISKFSLSKGGPPITRLFFANDSILFFKATAQECHIVRMLLDSYARVSGQPINFEKSDLSFSPNANVSLKNYLGQILGVIIVSHHQRYLGLLVFMPRNKVNTFHFLKDRIWKLLQGWKNELFSIGGKEVLIKAIVQAIPCYTMHCSRLPESLVYDLNRLMARFWRGSNGEERKIHWASWAHLCKPKSLGGSGFRDLEHFNKALLAK